MVNVTVGGTFSCISLAGMAKRTFCGSSVLSFNVIASVLLNRKAAPIPWVAGYAICDSWQIVG